MSVHVFVYVPARVAVERSIPCGWQPIEIGPDDLTEEQRAELARLVQDGEHGAELPSSMPIYPVDLDGLRKKLDAILKAKCAEIEAKEAFKREAEACLEKMRLWAKTLPVQHLGWTLDFPGRDAPCSLSLAQCKVLRIPTGTTLAKLADREEEFRAYCERKKAEKEPVHRLRKFIDELNLPKGPDLEDDRPVETTTAMPTEALREVFDASKGRLPAGWEMAPVTSPGYLEDENPPIWRPTRFGIRFTARIDSQVFEETVWLL